MLVSKQSMQGYILTYSRLKRENSGSSKEGYFTFASAALHCGKLGEKKGRGGERERKRTERC